MVSTSKKRKGIIDDEDEWDENDGETMDENKEESDAGDSFVASDDGSFEDEESEVSSQHKIHT